VILRWKQSLLLPFGEREIQGQGTEPGGSCGGGSGSSDSGESTGGNSVAGMIILTAAEQATMPVHVGASHSSRDGWDLQQQGSPSPEQEPEREGGSFGRGTPRSRVSVYPPPNPNPARRRCVPWNGMVLPAGVVEESSTQIIIKAMLLS
jgi:hypothetical protein